MIFWKKGGRRGARKHAVSGRDFQKRGWGVGGGGTWFVLGAGVDHILKLTKKSIEYWREIDPVEQSNWQIKLNSVYWLYIFFWQVTILKSEWYLWEECFPNITKIIPTTLVGSECKKKKIIWKMFSR